MGWRFQVNSNIKRKEQEKLKGYQGLIEELERMWGVKVTVVQMVMGVLGAVIPNLGSWLLQIPQIPSKISVEKSGILETAKILHRTQIYIYIYMCIYI